MLYFYVAQLRSLTAAAAEPLSGRQILDKGRVTTVKKNEFSIQDILRVLLSNIVWLILAAVIVGSIAWAYTNYRIPKMYRTEVSFFADSITNRDVNGDITTNELTSNRQLAANCAYILQSNTVMKMASEALKQQGINYSYRHLRSMLSVTTTNTSIFKATVSSTDKKNLPLIATTIAEQGVIRMKQIVDNGNITIVDPAEPPDGQYYPHPVRNTALGAIIGFAIAAIFFLVRSLTDTTVWNEDDLSKQYDVPVLGTIPLIVPTGRDSGNTYSAGKE